MGEIAEIIEEEDDEYEKAKNLYFLENRVSSTESVNREGEKGSRSVSPFLPEIQRSTASISPSGFVKVIYKLLHFEFVCDESPRFV